MASNQTNYGETLKQLITNWITAMLHGPWLHILETSGDITNIFELRDALADCESKRVLCAQVLQILEENGFHNGIEIEVVGNTTRNQSSSDTEVQESMENLGRGEISSNARIQELTEELEIYYERIVDHESLRDMFFELLLTVWLIAGPNGIFGRHLDSVLHFNVGFVPYREMELASRQSVPEFMTEVKEKLEEFLRKFLEIENSLNDQNN